MSDRKAGATRVGGGREAVLVAAQRNFSRFGYHGTSMRSIANDADMTVASIYHHFESKQEILQELMVRILSDLMSQTRAALMAADESPRHQLEALVFAWIVFHANRQQEAFVGSTEVRSLDPEGRRLVVALRDEQERMFREVIDRGARTGEFATAFPREATRAVINMGSSVASWYDAKGDLSPAQLAERYVALALGTVQAREV
jgi:AcrR family transcriptional regulator